MRKNSYKATFRSFLGSLTSEFSLILTALVGTYFFYETSPTVITILNVIVGLVFVSALLSTISAHLTEINIIDDGILLKRMSLLQQLSWEEIKKAKIRERRNKMSRTDRLVILEAEGGDAMMFCTSVFKKDDETEILRQIRSHVPTSTHFDNPTI